MRTHAQPRSPSRFLRRLGVPILLLTLTAALIAGAWLLVSSTSGYSWDDDAWVPIDGQGHVVSVERDELAMVWTYDYLRTPRCEVLDESGATVPLRPPSGHYSRYAGSAGDWVGTWTFTPTTEKVTVTCKGLGIQRRRSSVMA